MKEAPIKPSAVSSIAKLEAKLEIRAFLKMEHYATQPEYASVYIRVWPRTCTVSVIWINVCSVRYGGAWLQAPVFIPAYLWVSLWLPECSHHSCVVYPLTGSALTCPTREQTYSCIQAGILWGPYSPKMPRFMNKKVRLKRLWGPNSMLWSQKQDKIASFGKKRTAVFLFFQIERKNT